MNYTVSEPEAPVSLERLAELEAEYGFIFPAEYKAFLLQWNGGRIEPRNFTFGEETYEGSRIDWFLAVYDGRSSNFQKYLKMYAGRIPDNFIPIAHNDGGNLVCLAVSGEDVGAVYFWDHEYELDEEEECVSRISSNFDDFVNSLT